MGKRFMAWIDFLAHHEKRYRLLKRVEEWKKFVHPRVSEPLLAIITFYFEQLLPAYFLTTKSKRGPSTAGSGRVTSVFAISGTA